MPCPKAKNKTPHPNRSGLQQQGDIKIKRSKWNNTQDLTWMSERHLNGKTWHSSIQHERNIENEILKGTFNQSLALGILLKTFTHLANDRQTNTECHQVTHIPMHLKVTQFRTASGSGALRRGQVPFSLFQDLLLSSLLFLINALFFSSTFSQEKWNVTWPPDVTLNLTETAMFSGLKLPLNSISETQEKAPQITWCVHKFTLCVVSEMD